MQTARESAAVPFMGRAYAAKRGNPSRGGSKRGFQLVSRLSAALPQGPYQSAGSAAAICGSFTILNDI